jgi:hypothetical protein
MIYIYRFEICTVVLSKINWIFNFGKVLSFADLNEATKTTFNGV